MRVLATFMDTIAPKFREAIRQLEIQHHTYSFGPADYRIWKERHDFYYESTFWRVGMEMTGFVV